MDQDDGLRAIALDLLGLADVVFCCADLSLLLSFAMGSLSVYVAKLA